jgi:hypothetical protein
LGYTIFVVGAAGHKKHHCLASSKDKQSQQKQPHFLKEM